MLCDSSILTHEHGGQFKSPYFQREYVTERELELRLVVHSHHHTPRRLCCFPSPFVQSSRWVESHREAVLKPNKSIPLWETPTGAWKKNITEESGLMRGRRRQEKKKKLLLSVADAAFRLEKPCVCQRSAAIHVGVSSVAFSGYHPCSENEPAG